jgi:cold-inducible RNA-binding protein
MSTKIHVDNLDVATTENELSNLFSTYGNVMDVNISVDHAGHQPRRFAFVTMATPEGARAAIQALNGKAMGICSLSVSAARPREARVNSPHKRAA